MTLFMKTVAYCNPKNSTVLTASATMFTQMNSPYMQTLRVNSITNCRECKQQ